MYQKLLSPLHIMHTQPPLGNKDCRGCVQFLLFLLHNAENPGNLKPKHFCEPPFLERNIFMCFRNRQKISL